MDKKECYFLGYIKKALGSSGEVIAFLDVTNPADYKGMEMCFLEMESGLVPFFIESVQMKHKGEVLIKFEDIDDHDTALRIKGKQLFLPMEVLPKLSGTKFYYHEVIDFEVFDSEKGNIGRIVKILEMPQNDLFSINNAQSQEILIPINDDIIKAVNRDKKHIHIEAPEGLIELYINP